VLIDNNDQVALPWLTTPLEEALRSRRGHALLLHAAPGMGAMSMALALAQSYLCENSTTPHPMACGRCGSCKLVQAHGHPDLSVLLPETLRRLHHWHLADDKLDSDEAKKKPSKQIRIDDVRGLIDWSTKTSARGRGKVAVVHPADSLNPQSANALLKTLEEPPVGTRLILTSADPALLLPTVRSRCQHLRVPAPTHEQAALWLQQQGVKDAADALTLLQACSGRPLDALELSQGGVDAGVWRQLPRAVAQGHVAAFSGWPVPRVIDALQKLCHDALAVATGAGARFFPLDQVPRTASVAALAAWSHELQRVARHAEHPWNEALLFHALVAAGAKALAPVRKASFSAAPSARGLDTLRP
jgi:DNA polymerase III subunit delta'